MLCSNVTTCSSFRFSSVLKDMVEGSVGTLTVSIEDKEGMVLITKTKRYLSVAIWQYLIMLLSLSINSNLPWVTVCTFDRLDSCDTGIFVFPLHGFAQPYYHPIPFHIYMYPSWNAFHIRQCWCYMHVSLWHGSSALRPALFVIYYQCRRPEIYLLFK